jgi:excisionase family DNA binding protein
VDEGPETYTVDEAARILKLTPGRIRQMLRAGELEGIPPEESGGRGWKIPMHAVHDRDRLARVEHPLRPPESSERLSELEVEADVESATFAITEFWDVRLAFIRNSSLLASVVGLYIRVGAKRMEMIRKPQRLCELRKDHMWQIKR